MIKAVIFDLDDTLISERKYIESGYLHIANILCKRVSKSNEELYQLLIKLFKNSTKNVFNRLFDELKIPYTKHNITELVEEYRNHFPAIEFFDDVSLCLQDLKQLGLKMGIITDGYANAQRQKLKAVKAYEYVDEIIITDELGKKFWKPHPKSYEIIRGKLNVEYNEIIYVGDNPEKDFYIGCVYPIQTIRINREGVYKDRVYLNNVKEKYAIHSLSELGGVIRRLNRGRAL